MVKAIALLYGALAYLLFLVTFLYALGFVANVAVPKGIDDGEAGPLGAALLINMLLLAAFAIQHSVMARPGFKDWWTRIVPKSVERSTYVLVSSLLLILLFWQWRSMPDAVWSVEDQVWSLVIWIVFALGWLLVLLSTFIIDHFDLFGLRQVFLNFRGKEPPASDFKVSLFYKLVRHPLLLGWVIAFWAHPQMTEGHLLFAVVTTAYILIAIKFEERDLVADFGNSYRDYQGRVPMLIPFLKWSKKGP